MFNFFKKQAKTPFLPLYTTIAEQVLNGEILTPRGDRYTYQTAYNYKTGVSRLNRFESDCGIIYLEDISPAWAEKFITWQMQNGYCKNSIAVVLARIKAILNRLYKQGKSKYAGHGISAVGESVTTVYNTVEDIRTLLDLDLSEVPGKELVRDIYIIQCFIGLRFSDLSALLPDIQSYIRDIGGKTFFEIKTQKTGEVVVIPVANVVRQLAEKHQYNFSKIFSYQYYNLTIKDIALKAGLTQEIIFTRTEGGIRVDTPRPKWVMMSSHTARRTFATNAHLAGITDKSIMNITGHKTTQSFYRYIRCSALESAIEIANHPFFSIDLPVTKTIEYANYERLTDEG